MSENVTTLLQKTKIALSELLGTDLFYLVHGSDSNRDRALELQVLKQYIENFDDIKATKLTIEDGTEKTTVTKSGVAVEDSSNSYKCVTDNLGVKIYNGSTLKSYFQGNIIKLDGGMVVYDADSSKFKFDSGAIFRTSTEAGKHVVNINASDSNAYVSVSDNNGQGSQYSEMKVDGFKTTGYGKFDGGVVVSGTAESSFGGTVNFGSGAVLSGNLTMVAPNGNRYTLGNTNNGMQFYGAVNVQGNVVAIGSGNSIGGGSSAIVPKNYRSTSTADTASVSVNLQDNDFCFVSKAANSAGNVNKVTVTDPSCSAPATITASATKEVSAIVYRRGTKLYYSPMYN